MLQMNGNKKLENFPPRLEKNTSLMITEQKRKKNIT
jgi:hypothetical protein